MNILAIDPGAERCGWAVLAYNDCVMVTKDGNKLHPCSRLADRPFLADSGIIRFPREGMPFQQYRVALERFYTEKFDDLMDAWRLRVAVNETIPAVGGGNFVVATQSYLANCVVTAYHISAFRRSIAVYQQGATTVHSKIALKKTKGKKVTKAQVRNGVLTIMPELRPRLKDWVKVFDEVDAIANGLAYLGYNIHDFT